MTADKFDPELFKTMSFDFDDPEPPHDPGKLIRHLQAYHRDLSEQILECNRQLSRLEVADNDEGKALRQRVADLQFRREEIDADLQTEISAIPASKEGKEHKKGLIRQRHPNRDFFLADLLDYAIKDDGVTMEAPIYTLSTKPDLDIWEWRSKDGNKYVKVTPSVLGRATVKDKDILIYVVSQLIEGLNRGREDAQNRTARFTVHDFLVTTNRGTSGDDYDRLHESFERLRGTSITTDIRTGGERVKEGFGIIDKWKIIERSKTDERMIAVEVTLSEWLYNAVSAFEVLTIHPDYFRLRKPLARRLYELARKHCGHQASWAIGLELLRDKSGSKSSLKEFRRMVRDIETDNSLPEYQLMLSRDDKVTFYVRDTARLVRSINKRPGGV